MSEARQLDKNVFISIKQPTPPPPPSTPSTPSTPSAAAPSATPPPVDNPAPLIDLDFDSPFSSTASTTRASTPSSTSSSLPAPTSPASAATPASVTTNKPAKRRLTDISTTHDSDNMDDGGTALSEGGKGAAGKAIKRARGQPRGTKGLRYFSILVCNKLSECATASYNHIADLLIEESRRDKRDEGRKTAVKTAAAATGAISTGVTVDVPTTGEDEGDGGVGMEGEEKNVRRRIYDALNVLMAIDMIVKDKKMIRWNGPPLHTLTSSASSSTASPPPDRLSELRTKRAALLARLADKRSLLTEQVLEYVGMRALLERNAEVESGAIDGDDVRLYFPFVLVNTARSTAIDCEMSEGRDAVSMRYSDVFSLHDQSVVVRMVGRGRERLWENIPKELQEFVVGLDEERRQGEEREKERRDSERKEMEEERQRLVDETRRRAEEMRTDDEEDSEQPGAHMLSRDMLLSDETDALPRILSAAPFASPLHLQRINTSQSPYPILPSPPHSSFLSSGVSASYLQTPFKPSPLTKHLSVFSSASLSPSSPFLCVSSYPALGLPFSPTFLHSSPSRSLSTSSPLLQHTAASASSPFASSLSSRPSLLASNARLVVPLVPASSSRLFAGGGDSSSGGVGGGVGGGSSVRRANSLLLGSGVLSGDEPMSSPQIIVS